MCASPRAQRPLGRSVAANFERFAKGCPHPTPGAVPQLREASRRHHRPERRKASLRLPATSGAIARPIRRRPASSDSTQRSLWRASPRTRRALPQVRKANWWYLRTERSKRRCACPRPSVSLLGSCLYRSARGLYQSHKSRPLNGCSRHPATVSTGEKSTGARQSEVGLLVTFVHDGGRLDGQTGCALYGSGPGHDPSPKIEKLIFGAPEVRTYLRSADVRGSNRTIEIGVAPSERLAGGRVATPRRTRPLGRRVGGFTSPTNIQQTFRVARFLRL